MSYRASDPLRAPGTDEPAYEAPSGTGCVLAFLAELVVVVFIVGFVIGRWVG